MKKIKGFTSYSEKVKVGYPTMSHMGYNVKGSEMQKVMEYDATLDSKNRLVIRGNKEFKHFSVTMREDGSILLSPRVLAHPSNVIDKKTLEMIDRSMKAIKAGKRGKEFKMSDFKGILDEKNE